MCHPRAIRDAEAVGHPQAFRVGLAERRSVGRAQRIAVADRIAVANGLANAVTQPEPVAVSVRVAERIRVSRLLRGAGREFGAVRPADRLAVGYGHPVAEPIAIADRIADPQPVAVANRVAVAEPGAEPECLAVVEPGAKCRPIAECRVGVRLAARVAASVPDTQPVRRGVPGPERVAGDRANTDTGRQLARASEAGPPCRETVTPVTRSKRTVPVWSRFRSHLAAFAIRRPCEPWRPFRETGSCRATSRAERTRTER